MALKATKNSGIQPALDWLAEQQDDTKESNKEDVEDTEPKSLKCNDCDKLFSSVAMAQLHATKTGHQDFSESSEQRPELTPEEKTARLAELRARLDEKRQEEKIREEQEKREAELLRRKSGHTAAMARRELQEKEMIKAAEQLRKDKEEEKIIRAKIRAEMEEEKRQRKAAAEESTQNVPQQEPVQLVSHDADSVRIQVKLAGGESIRAVFKPAEKLSVLLNKISEKVEITQSNKLIIPFPRQTINISTESDKTLMELGLCPSASLIFE